MPLSSILSDMDKDSSGEDIKNKKMIKDFLIIDCTGKNDSLALKVNNKFFIKKLQTNLIKNEILALEILNFVKKYKIKLDDNFSIFINSGPGSFSGIRISLSVVKGIQIVKNTNTYSYNNFLLNASPYLSKKQEIVSIEKTNNFYYYSESSFKDRYTFTMPNKISPDCMQKEDSIFVAPQEIISDEIFNNISPKKIKAAQFDLKNIEILIKNNLLENKLIKPLYLS